MNIVICRGVESPDMDWNNQVYCAEKDWIDWVQFESEAEHDVITQIPKFPHAHAKIMKYDEWEQIMNLQDITPDTCLIGHSAGGGFLLKYMQMHPDCCVKQIILVAPWIDVENWQPFGFYRGLDLQRDIILQTKYGIDMLVSDNDMPHIVSGCGEIMKNMPNVRVHSFNGYEHFCRSKLPEIMSIIKF